MSGLVTWVTGRRATLVCPQTRVGGGVRDENNRREAGDGWRALFYHLGQVYTDYELVRHGAQDVVLRLLLSPKTAPTGSADLEIDADQNAVLRLHAPTLLGLLLGKGFV